MKNSKLTKSFVALVAIAVLALPGLSFAKDSVPDKAVRPLWGDLHLHTQWSCDTGLFGMKVGPEDALRFARGEMVKSTLGGDAKLKRPLDFLAVTDHAEYVGLTEMFLTANPKLLASPRGKQWYETYTKEKSNPRGEKMVALAWDILFGSGSEKDVIGNPELVRSTWERYVDILDKYNEPGKFTSLIAYEWTSIAGKQGNNLHRNVIFRDDAKRTKQIVPFSALDSFDPEDLWKFMGDYETKTGGRVLAIPHNGNLANGLMFPWPGGETKRVSGAKVDANYAKMRKRWEPLYEVTQIKGDGEAHPLLSPTDEFADFETWDAFNILTKPNRVEWLPGQYAREALKQGLRWQQLLGANPYSFGLIGATDNHNGFSATREDNYWGKVITTEPSAGRFKHPFMESKGRGDLKVFGWQESAAGLTAVWAPENTREAIFDGLARKEAYATSGSRIVVRVFAGWDFTDKDLKRDFVKKGYARGVPMGGELKERARGASPRLMIQASKDPDGANLDRIQIIKGWLDGNGETHERVYDVAVSDGRKIGKDGRCRTPVGNTVDLAKAKYTNTIGAPNLKATWEDPDFDPKQRAFYYVRVIEIPKPRWTAYDEVRYKVSMPPHVPRTTQDRAYTSPIWYIP